MSICLFPGSLFFYYHSYCYVTCAPLRPGLHACLWLSQCVFNCRQNNFISARIFTSLLVFKPDLCQQGRLTAYRPFIPVPTSKTITSITRLFRFNFPSLYYFVLVHKLMVPTQERILLF